MTVAILIFALVVLLIVGTVIWAIQTYLPIEATFKNLISFVLVIIGVVLVAQRAGVF